MQFLTVLLGTPLFPGIIHQLKNLFLTVLSYSVLIYSAQQSPSNKNKNNKSHHISNPFHLFPHLETWLISVYSLTCLGWLDTPFGLVIGFINHTQVVTTITYNTVTHLQSLHASLSQSICISPHFIIRCCTHTSLRLLIPLLCYWSSLLTSQLSLTITCCT
jgi:hypothetical protein